MGEGFSSTARRISGGTIIAQVAEHSNASPEAVVRAFYQAVNVADRETSVALYELRAIVVA
jgi:hypothetical protein